MEGKDVRWGQSPGSCLWPRRVAREQSLWALGRNLTGPYPQRQKDYTKGMSEEVLKTFKIQTDVSS